MNVLNNSNDDVVECPLCMEPLEVDDLNFFPCTCGYQICRFCWHRIRTDENELCPACRKAYPENPADFTPLSQEQIQALKAEKRQRDQQRKQKITENRKHLANVRVVQKNLVFVVGLPPRLADADILKKHEYFGKYGKIHKVVINPSTTYAGVQGPSASAYVTYVHNNDALRAIQSVNNIVIDGRLIKTSLGTTKYCSHFMKNQQCPKGDCMYLHELGDHEASFTKEEMHQGKHQEYEKRLHDTLIASSNGSVTTNGKNGDTKLANGTGPVQGKEAWPSLSVSPVGKESTKGKGKENGSKSKSKSDKKGQKHQKGSSNHSNSHNNSGSNKENSNAASNGIGNHIANQNGTKDTTTTSDGNTSSSLSSSASSSSSASADSNGGNHQKSNQQLNHLCADDEINLIADLEKDALNDELDGKNADTRSLSSTTSSNNGDSGSLSDSTSGKSSPGSFPDHPLSTTAHETNSNTNNHDISSDADTLENHTFENNPLNSTSSSSSTTTNLKTTTQQLANTADINCVTDISKKDGNRTTLAPATNGIMDTSACLSKLSLFDDNNSFFSTSSFQPLLKGKLEHDANTNSSRTVINNHLNNAINSHLPDLLNGIDGYQQSSPPAANGIPPTGNASNGTSGNNGVIDNPEKYLLSLNTSEDWEAAFKYVMMRNNKQLEEQQEEFLRMQEMQKRNNLINSMGGGMPQVNGGIHDFNADFFHNGADINRLSQAAMFQQQQQQHQHQQRQPNNIHHNDHMVGNNLFGTNMSKFFDFHKNQQQQQQQHQHQQFLMNGHSNGMVNDHRDHLSMATLLENNRLNSQYLEHTNGLIGQQLQKQRLLNKFDQMGSHNHNMLINTNNNSSSMQQPNRIHNQFNQNATVDDDLGFDPFIETQKALAELMENEMVQQPTPNNHNKHLLENCQRTRMPPPGFNHMNAFGFGVPRAQGSKILPFMNMGNNPAGPSPQQNNWAQHMGFQQQQQQQMNEHQQQQAHLAQQQNQNGSTQHSKTGYGNMADWTAMDPAILSFRQFPSYSNNGPSHQHQQQQHTTPDMFMQHLTQQNVQQSGQGFGHHGINLQNNIMNQQQNSPAQVNYSHSNWLNSEQNMFMNSLANGYSRNKQQKTECIN